ncbi:6-bladed beta-propeller [Algoriphagus boritolerans]|uniref:6-bladed beta-propeller n=1 Tax=Algoriphagus boritolerans TaxID=308111 RepID=UPI003A0FD509
MIFFSKLDSEGYNFVNSFNDTIYHIKETGNLSPAYVIDFGENKLLESDLLGKGYSSIVDVFQFINSTDKSFNVGNVFESKKISNLSIFQSGKSLFISI